MLFMREHRNIPLVPSRVTTFNCLNSILFLFFVLQRSDCEECQRASTTAWKQLQCGLQVQQSHYDHSTVRNVPSWIIFKRWKIQRFHAINCCSAGWIIYSSLQLCWCHCWSVSTMLGEVVIQPPSIWWEEKAWASFRSQCLWLRGCS